MKFIILAAAAALAFTTVADAKTCLDPKTHKFTKCAAPAAAPAKPSPAKPMFGKPAVAKAAPCKDAKGHFIKCGAPAAAPAAVTKTSTARTGGAAKCKTGIPCGKSCIPKGKVCHK